MIAKRLPHLLARFAYARKHDALPMYPNPLQMLQLAARNNIKPATKASEIFQNRQIAVRFHSKAKRMRQGRKASVKLTINIANSRLAINISRRSNFVGYLAKRNIFAIYARPSVGAQHCCAPFQL